MGSSPVAGKSYTLVISKPPQNICLNKTELIKTKQQSNILCFNIRLKYTTLNSTEGYLLEKVIA